MPAHRPTHDPRADQGGEEDRDPDLGAVCPRHQGPTRCGVRVYDESRQESEDRQEHEVPDEPACEVSHPESRTVDARSRQITSLSNRRPPPRWRGPGLSWPTILAALRSPGAPGLLLRHR